jgi:hypothetical protein
MTDPIEFIKAVHKAGIRYLLIGRQAMIAHGIPVVAKDYDLYIDGSPEKRAFERRGFALYVPTLYDLIKLKKTERYKDEIDRGLIEKFIKLKERGLEVNQ